jgi:DNA-directed RNA polymerase subunit K/omega
MHRQTSTRGGGRMPWGGADGPELNPSDASKTPPTPEKPVLTRYELVRVLSARAQQLAEGVNTTLKSHSSTPFRTAMDELTARRIPMSVVRKFPDGRTQTLSVNACDVPESVFSHVRSLEL